MTKVYAVVEDGMVVNTVLWDGVSDWGGSKGVVVELSDDSEVGIGWSYDGELFTPPENIPDEQP